ncbi:MAG: lipase secretion chaperone [Pseudomonadota bacterium]
MNIKHGLWAGAIAGAATLGFSLFLLSPEKPESPSPEGSVTELNSPTSSRAVEEPPAGAETETRELPLDDTVEGVAIDGEIRVDMNGNLVYDRDLRRFMDFFIGLTQSPDDGTAMRERMRQAMREQEVPEAIRQDVMSALDRYLSYREAAADLENRDGESSPEQTRALLKELKQLRRSHLGEAMAEGFFGREQERIENQLARQRIQNNPDLSEAEKRERILDLEEDLPEYTHQVRERSRTYNNLHEETRRMREEGASEAEIRELRTEELGAEAANRLAKLDDQRAQWQSRLEAYQERKQRLQDNDNLTETDRRDALERLRSEHFDSEAERRRARALSRIDASRQDG